MKYRFVDTGKQKTVLILPSAGYTAGSYDGFVQLMSKKANVVLIESGYYGISRLPTPTDQYAKEFRAEQVATHLATILKTHAINKVILIGSSIGSIYGFEFYKRFPKLVSGFVAIAPPLCTPKFIRFLMLPLISIGLFFGADNMLQFFTKIGKSFPKFKGITRYTFILEPRIGADGCAYYLQEIGRYTLANRPFIYQTLTSFATVIFGNQDPVLTSFFDKKILASCRKLHLLNCGHAVLMDAAGDVEKLL